MTATLDAMSKDQFEVLCNALMNAMAQAKKTKSRGMFAHLKCCGERPVVQLAQNRFQVLSQRSDAIDSRCNLGFRIKGLCELDYGSKFATLIEQLHHQDGKISVDAIAGGIPFINGTGGELCVPKPHFDMSRVQGKSTTQGRATLLGFAVESGEEHGIDYFKRGDLRLQMDDATHASRRINSVFQRAPLCGVAMPPEGFCSGKIWLRLGRCISKP